MTLLRVRRIETIKHPRVGQIYSVPAVLEKGRSVVAAWWPVLGPMHEDGNLFDFPPQHFHFDPRFLTKGMLRVFTPYRQGRSPLDHSLAAPLMGERKPFTVPPQWEAPATPVLKQFKCVRTSIDYPFADRERVIKINTMFRDVQADRAKAGWLCPHRRVTLNFPPDSDGMITCPLHGLRVDAATGKCVGPKARLTYGKQQETAHG